MPKQSVFLSLFLVAALMLAACAAAPPATEALLPADPGPVLAGLT